MHEAFTVALSCWGHLLRESPAILNCSCRKCCTSNLEMWWSKSCSCSLWWRAGDCDYCIVIGGSSWGHCWEPVLSSFVSWFTPKRGREELQQVCLRDCCDVGCGRACRLLGFSAGGWWPSLVAESKNLIPSINWHLCSLLCSNFCQGFAVVSRYMSQGKYVEARELMYSGALLFFSHNQVCWCFYVVLGGCNGVSSEFSQWQMLGWLLRNLLLYLFIEFCSTKKDDSKPELWMSKHNLNLTCFAFLEASPCC